MLKFNVIATIMSKRSNISKTSSNQMIVAGSKQRFAQQSYLNSTIPPSFETNKSETLDANAWNTPFDYSFKCSRSKTQPIFSSTTNPDLYQFHPPHSRSCLSLKLLNVPRNQYKNSQWNLNSKAAGNLSLLNPQPTAFQSCVSFIK